MSLSTIYRDSIVILSGTPTPYLLTFPSKNTRIVLFVHDLEKRPLNFGGAVASSAFPMFYIFIFIHHKVEGKIYAQLN